MQVVESAVEFVLVLKQAGLEVHKEVVIDRKHNFFCLCERFSAKQATD